MEMNDRIFKNRNKQKQGLRYVEQNSFQGQLGG